MGSSGLEFATHIGCLTSNLEEFHNKFVLSDVLVLKGKLTPEICVNHCKSEGFKYASLHSSFNCLCSNSRPQFNVSTDISDCYYRCEDNINEICKMHNRVNVYKICDEPSYKMDKNYIGCFLDGGTRERILATKKAIKQKFITPEACISFCFKKGFKYAGITYRFLCSCDNQLGTKKNEELCSKCSKDAGVNGERKMYMRLYYTNLTISESARLIGCYKEISNEARLLSGATQNFKNTLTPEKCISFCKGKGFLYAGLQYSYECFCAKERPSFINSADSSDCNSKCDGDKTKICGGGFRLSVYDLADKPVNYVQPNYVGCYADEGGRRALTGKVAPESQEMTPELCVGFCFRNGYRYAGLQYRNQCFCGEEPLGPRSSEGDCDMECAGDKRFLCGGGWRNSIYHTSIPNESEEGKLIGCFIDNESLRLLSGFRLDIPETNSPRKCMNICKQLGYSYAGVQYGVECHCGNRKPESEKETNENECLATCPDGTRRCGGNWRLLIYTTASVMQPVISGIIPIRGPLNSTVFVIVNQ